MDPSLAALISVLLILSNAFFVAAEYALVASRRTRVEALAQKGSKTAQSLLKVMDQAPRYVAGIQVGITVCGLAIGSLTEPLVSKWIESMLGAALPVTARFIIALILVTFVLVVVGELVPKYLTLKHPERLALALVRPLRIIVLLFSPIASFAQAVGGILLKPFGVDINKMGESAISREELTLLVRAGENEGMLEESHANVVAKALRFDKLDAADIMIHRLDIKWIDVEFGRDEVLEACAKIPHSRVPVCRGDIDDVVGVLYVQDLLRKPVTGDFSLEKLVRPVEAVPENLTLNKIVNRMRDERTQILLVVDEYGGTSGLITLEDVVEEVFGEIEDQIESERPPIERLASNRLSARAEVRYDEILDFLEIEPTEESSTQTLAQLLIDSLERMPKLGDSVEIDIGALMVENMARQRITRVRILLKPELHETPEPKS